MNNLSIITCMTETGLIGKGLGLPWEIGEDLRYFKETTMGKPILMGSTTYKSIGKKLPGRTNIVLTRDKDFTAEDCVVVYSIEEALKLTEDFAEVMIIGGSNVYKQFLPLVNKMYITELKGKYQGGVYFPDFNREDFEETSRIKVKKAYFELDFTTLKRKNND